MTHFVSHRHPTRLPACTVASAGFDRVPGLGEIPAPARRDVGHRFTPFQRPCGHRGSLRRTPPVPTSSATAATARLWALNPRGQYSLVRRCRTCATRRQCPPLPAGRAPTPGPDPGCPRPVDRHDDPKLDRDGRALSAGFALLRECQQRGSEQDAKRGGADGDRDPGPPCARADDDASASRAANLTGGLPAVQGGLWLYVGPNFSSGRGCRRRDKSSGRTRMWRATHTL